MMINFVFILLSMSISFLCFAINIVQSPVCFSVSTSAITGDAEISVKVPGTFQGLGSLTNLRYLKRVDIESDVVTVGDYIDNIEITDADGVIPVPLRAQFPSYPQIFDFSVDESVATGSKSGYYFGADGKITIESISGEAMPVPSGLYIKAKINNGGLLSRTYRINVIWGRAG
jgi:hypothetical protein